MLGLISFLVTGVNLLYLDIESLSCGCLCVRLIAHSKIEQLAFRHWVIHMYFVVVDCHVGLPRFDCTKNDLGTESIFITSVVPSSYRFPAYLVSSTRGVPACALGHQEFAAVSLPICTHSFNHWLGLRMSRQLYPAEREQTPYHEMRRHNEVPL